MSTPSSRPQGSMHRGLTEFLVQRVSSLYLAGFTVYVIVWFLLNPNPDYAAWTAHMSKGIVRIVWGLFFVSLLAHAWVGMRSIFMDYLHPTWLRLTAYSVTALALIAAGLWAVVILAKGIV